MKLKLINKAEQTGNIGVDETKTVVVGGPSGRRFALKPPSKRTLVGLFVALSVLIVVGFGFYKLVIDRFAFTAGDIKLTSAQYDKLIKGATTKGVKEPAAKQYVNRLLIRKAAAHKVGLTVAGEAKAPIDNWSALQTYDANMELELQRKHTGGYEGGVVYFPFDRMYISTIIGYPTPAGYGELDAIQSAQQKASEKATAMRSDLASGKITIQQAVASMAKDSNFLFAGSGNDSELFSVDRLGNDSQHPQSDRLQPFLLSDLQNLEQPGVSTVLSMTRTFNGEAPFGLPDPMISAYYVIDLTKIEKPDTAIRSRFDVAVNRLQEDVL